ncbi:MAG: GTP pyrophosphokinase family protein [Bacilli bacterium]|nr:GTP pyrophosphokinase family protein [Bacilli bacterium]
MNKEEKQLDEYIIKCEYALEMLHTQLDILIKEYQIRNKINAIEHVKTRVKSKDSIMKKLEKKGYNNTIEDIKNHIHDLIGVRIVCSFLSDVYEIANLIESNSNIKVLTKKDYIKNPKESGYTSYHINVLVPIYLSNGVEEIEAEIQIRTMAMDFWAALDHKIQYKFPMELPLEIEKEMYNCSLDIKELDRQMLTLNEIVSKYLDKK